jgi:hypothetical protein
MSVKLTHHLLSSVSLGLQKCRGVGPRVSYSVRIRFFLGLAGYSSLEILNNQWHFSVGRGQVPPGASLGGNNGKKY